jgi:hypothetical protein
MESLGKGRLSIRVYDILRLTFFLAMKSMQKEFATASHGRQTQS